MRSTTRTVISALAAAPLVIGATAPSMAAPADNYKGSSAANETEAIIVGSLGEDAGNVHVIRVRAEIGQDWSTGYGDIHHYSCPEGVTDPYAWDEETEQELCTWVGFSDIFSDDVTATTGKKLDSGTIAGTFSWTEWSCTDDWEDCTVAAEGSYEIDLALTATSRAKTNKTTDTYRDPETGSSFRSTMTHTWRDATVSGTVNGLEVVGQYGTINTYTHSYKSKF